MNRSTRLLIPLILFITASICGCGDDGGIETTNQPPTANAGNTQSITLPQGQTATSIALEGSGTDSDGTIASYVWSGSPNPDDVAQPVVTLGVGSHTFTLVVTDNQGSQSAPASVTIVVNPAPSPPTKALFVFTATIPPGSTDQIGSVDMTVTIPSGVTLPIVSGQVPEANLYFSGKGAEFKALANATASIIGNYAPATLTTKATVSVHLVALLDNVGTAQSMAPGEFATLACDITPGATLTAADFSTPLTDLLVANATGTKLLDSQTGLPSPALATISYQVHQQ